MLTEAQLELLRASLPGDPGRRALLQTLERRAEPVLAQMPSVPRVKALLSRDGGVCPHDGSALAYDPWSPQSHACTRCGRQVSGDRQYRHWARAQHLWIAERAAELALIGAVTGKAEMIGRSAELLAAYHTLYFDCENRDNVLGPTHLFFSTYLESLWITSYLAAAFTLRSAGALTEAHVEAVGRIAEEAAGLIGEFNEGLSNRQTWHAAALAAIAAWFEDTDLLETAVQSRTGLLGHLAEGFGSDGLWWEGENYHLFALRGLMHGITWARAMDWDLLEDREVRDHFRAALLAPACSALPDLTYPARRDARYGVSLAEPASLELWEIGRAWLEDDPELDAWVAALYGAPVPATSPLYDAWLHDAGFPRPGARSPSDLSWWALTALKSSPVDAAVWQPGSTLLPGQGLAVLRREDCYVSLECGRDIGGHGHPDRLHLTYYGGGVHWLPDFGTGSYVEPSLAWYRSALAHNAPLVDGVNAAGADAWCAAFDQVPPWAWVRAIAGGLTRTVVLGPDHLLDIVELGEAETGELLLPWHFLGELHLESAVAWEPATLTHPFVHDVERANTGDLRRLTVRAGGSSLRVLSLAPGAGLLRAVAPGLPTTGEPAQFLVLTGRGPARWITVLDPTLTVNGLGAEGDAVRVDSPSGVTRYQFTPQGVEIVHREGRVGLAGTRQRPEPHAPLFAPRDTPAAEAFAPRIDQLPALDGSLDGFDLDAPLTLGDEHQYRRSEDPYDPEAFAATAWVNWDGDAMYLAVTVAKPELVIRAPDAAALELDNEPDDIHADGLQIFVRHEDDGFGTLVVLGPDGTLSHRPIAETTDLSIEGAWATAENGYAVTLRLDHRVITRCWAGARIGFDLLINEMRPGRVRRAGQLVWSGGNGWIYLRGDRQDPRAFGVLELG